MKQTTHTDTRAQQLIDANPGTPLSAAYRAVASEFEAALNGVLHHNDAVKDKYKLPASLIRQIEKVLNG